MPVVVFVAPLCNAAALASLEALAKQPDISLGVISHFAQEQLPLHIRLRLAAHWQTASAADTAELLYAAEKMHTYFGKIDVILSTNEHVQEALALIREKFGIAGMRPDVAHNFRDKARMKQHFFEHQIPCARFQRLTSRQAAYDFIEQVGFPIILKPLCGAGSLSTFFVDTYAQLETALAQLNPSEWNVALAEEFISGAEHSLETVMHHGKAVWQSVSRYLPNALDVMQNAWIQWRIIVPNAAEQAAYRDIRHAGQAALSCLGLETGISHLEWFRRPDARFAISEVGARPPGAQILTLHSRAFGCNLYEEWIRLMVYDQFSVPTQRYACGVAFLRAQGYGVIKHVTGLDEVMRECSALITDVQPPKLHAAPTGTYEGDGFIIVRHEETAKVEQALEYIINTVRVTLG